MPLPEPEFSLNTVVRRRSNPDQVGTVISASWDEQVQDWHYMVRFGTGRRGVPASDLELLPPDRDLIDELLGGRTTNATVFRTLLTYERLNKPPSRVAASFGSAKAAFYPYQFTPLLKFIENPSQRILIADEVGLGKTIEAGYILRELQARHALQRILIVVPAQLRSKWKGELERRFAERFDIVSGREFASLRQRLEKGRELEPFRWIASYETVRLPANIQLVDQFKPPIDLAIFDEAHRLRNPETQQAKFGRALGEAVDALLLLTATPVQTKMDDLFWLLHLLEPERFASPMVFAEQIEANRPILRALRQLRMGSQGRKEALRELESLRNHHLTRDLTLEPFFAEIQKRLRQQKSPSRRELVALQREISELSLTGPLISRTRKVDVYPDRLPRRPQVVHVGLSKIEQLLYDEIGHLFQMLRPDLQDQGLRLALTTILRMAGSCLPAAAKKFEKFLENRLTNSELAEEYDAGDAARDELETEILSVRQDRILLQAQTALRGFLAGTVPDSKLQKFLEVLREVWAEDGRAGLPRRKIIVFSTFLDTIRFLTQQLSSRGIAFLRIDGSVPIREREIILDRFQEEDIHLLISSEVGSEGIDLQFASVLVNYDLPWNPMVVEQRIGRLDRIGQKSPIVVVSLVLAETIEERILERLYTRLGVYEETIGELEPILGEQQVEKLMIKALRANLSPAEQRQLSDQTADALLAQEATAKLVRQGADDLLAADQAFLDEIQGLSGGRRIPNGSELLWFLRGVLARDFPGCFVPDSLAKGAGNLEVTVQVAEEIRKLPPDPEASRVAGLLDGGELFCTFSQEVALTHSRAELLHARHPMLRFATEWVKTRGSDIHRAFDLHLCSDQVPSGRYAFGVYFIQLTGGRPRTEIRSFFIPLGQEGPLPEDQAELLFVELLDRVDDPSTPTECKGPLLESALRRIQELASWERQHLLEGESAINAARAARRRTTLENTHRAREKGAEERLRKLLQSGAAAFAVRMAEARLNKVTGEHRTALRTVESEEVLRAEDVEVALGMLTIEGRA